MYDSFQDTPALPITDYFSERLKDVEMAEEQRDEFMQYVTNLEVENIELHKELELLNETIQHLMDEIQEMKMGKVA